MMATLDLNGLATILEGLGLGPLPSFEEAHVLDKPLDIGRSYLADILRNLTGCDSNVAYSSIQWPNDIFTADLTVPLPRLIHSADPKALAIDLMQRWPSCPLFISPFKEGVQLRVMFKAETLLRLLIPYVNDRRDLYGQDHSIGLRDTSSNGLSRQKLVIEFSSPNIASGFHDKHLRSTVLGACIANLHKNMGWDVVKINYLGDWGKEIALLGVGWGRFGSEEQFQADPIRHILIVYNQIDKLFQPEVAASRAARDSGGDTTTIEAQGLFAERNAYFKRMEDGDEETLALWRRFQSVNIEHYIKQCARLNFSFDEYSGESQVSSETMTEIEDLLKNKGISEECDGACVVDLQKHGGAGRVIIRDRNGSGTYQLRELAAVLDRSRKYSFDKMIYVVADDHDTHFKRIIKVLELMDMSNLAHKLHHIHFHINKDKSPQKEEKPGHEYILGEIIDQCQNAMHESLKAGTDIAAVFGDSDEAAAALGISGLLSQEALARRGAAHSFSVEKSTSFGRGTGPELQYWYAKLCTSIGGKNSDLSALSDEGSKSIEEEKYIDLLRILAQYPEITSTAYRSLEPSIIMNYLVTITDQLMICLETEEDEEKTGTTPAKVALFEIVRQVLENGMKLLGIKPATRV